MIIGFDAHNVLWHRDRLKSKVARELFGVTIPPGLFQKDSVIQQGFLTDSEYTKVRQVIRGISVAELPQVEGVFTYIPQLVADGHSLFVLTSNEGPELAMVGQWVQYHDLPLAVIGCGYNKSKAPAAQFHSLDVYVDDDLCKLFEVREVVPYRFLFTQDHNHAIEEGDIASRVSSWEDLYHKISTLSAR